MEYNWDYELLVSDELTLLFKLQCISKFFFNVDSTNVCAKILPNVLFFLSNAILVKPSHSVYDIGGEGFLGSIRTTAESTLGGGRKLFFPTCKDIK